MPRHFRLTIFCVLFFVCLILTGCDNRGLEPIRSGIGGTITYTGEWPATAAEVRLVAAKTFPPTDLSDLIIGESIPVDKTEYPYTFYLTPGTYALVGVAWRAEGASWDIISVCGLYFDSTDSLSPTPITIPDKNTIVPGINIGVNRSRAHKVTDTHITGSVTFAGSWPDSIREARVIATTRFSIIPLQLPTLLDISFSNSIPAGSDSATYTINAFPGTYAAIGVLFFRAGQTLSLDDIAYSISVKGLNLAPLEVPENSTTAGPNFAIDFNAGIE